MTLSEIGTHFTPIPTKETAIYKYEINQACGFHMLIPHMNLHLLETKDNVIHKVCRLNTLYSIALPSKQHMTTTTMKNQ